jgi:hypothetical protein
MTIPLWRADRDYYPIKDARRVAHLRNIEVQDRINRRIAVTSAEGDSSYSIVVTPKDIA